MKQKLNDILKKVNICFLVIILISIILSIPMFSKKLDVYIDDGIQHVARAYGTFQTMKEGYIFPRIISFFANGFGYSWNLFYGPLSTYGIIFCKIFMSSWVGAYKLFTYICLLLSGIFMYKFVYKFSESKKTGLLASVLYMMFPYHLTDLYIRNALGEYVSFIFIPLVFLGLYNLFNNKEENYYLAIGAIGLILTHNLSTMIVAFFSLIYVLINIKSLKEKYVQKSLVINIVFIMLITSFYWAPLLETKIKANYQVYEPNAMSSIEQIESQSLKINRLFATPTGENFVFELGPHIIIMFVFSFLAFKTLKENKKEFVFFIVAGIFCLWMTTKYFPWRILPKSTYIIQFPWRMLQMSAFFLSIVCSINMQEVIKNYKMVDTFIIIGISLLYIISLKPYVPYLENEISKIEDWNLGVMSGKEVEVVAGTAKAEYLPKKAFDNRFYIASRDNEILTIKGKAIIEDQKKENGYFEAKVSILEDGTAFELPFIYYPGYEVRLDGIVNKNTFETEKGFLGVVLESDKTVKLEVKYVGTKIMTYTNIISFISFVIFIVYVWKRREL